MNWAFLLVLLYLLPSCYSDTRGNDWKRIPCWHIAPSRASPPCAPPTNTHPFLESIRWYICSDSTQIKYKRSSPIHLKWNKTELFPPRHKRCSCEILDVKFFFHISKSRWDIEVVSKLDRTQDFNKTTALWMWWEPGNLRWFCLRFCWC